MKYAWAVAIAVVLTCCFTMAVEADFSEGFDNFQLGVRPQGWNFSYCGQNSDANMVVFGDAAPGITLDAYGDQIRSIEYTVTGASELSFYLEALAANPSSALLVREYDGGAWSRLTWIESIPMVGDSYSLALNNSSSQQIEFTYKKALGEGNVVIDDIALTGVLTPEPSPTPAIIDAPDYLVVDWDDYNGLGKTNLAVYDPATGDWTIDGVGTITFGGGVNDVPAPGDYDGDGIADVAYFDRASGEWYARPVAGGSIYSGEVWGIAGDFPAPGDYNGDGTTNLATWRPSDGRWRIKDITNVWFGQADGMFPVPGDYNGDGTTDIAMVYPTTGIWYVNGVRNRNWWAADAVARPMDYTGDGTTEIGFYRPSTGWWYPRQLDGAVTYSRAWGVPSKGDISAVGDFDGDGTADLATFRPAINRWWILNSGGPYSYADFNAQTTDKFVIGATSY